MSYLIKYSSLLIILIFILTSLSLASPPPTFTKVNETGVALYSEFVLGIDTDEISYWIINDSTWMVRGPGINLYPQIKDSIPIVPIQIQYNDLENCKDILNLLPEPLDSSIDSGYIYRLPVSMLPILDSIGCINKTTACNDTIFSFDLRNIPDYKLSFNEVFDTDSIKFKFATSPLAFKKVNETGIALYRELILGENQSDLFVWKVSDTAWLAHHDNKEIAIKIKDDTLYLPIQIQIDTAIECSSVMEYLYKNTHSITRTYYGFQFPLNKIPLLDRINCIIRIVTRYSHGLTMDRRISGYEMLYSENIKKNALIISLTTRRISNYTGYILVGEPNMSADTVIISPSVENEFGDFILPAIDHIRGEFNIPLTLTKYKLFIDCYTDTASFDVCITDDSIHVAPLGISSVVLDTSPHKRVTKSK